jgi:flagellar biosynthesis/type III secretory pathway protein FliH
MAINISISAADVAEVRHALRQLLGDDQPAPATLAAAIADAVEVADAPVPAAAPAVAPVQQKRRGRPPKAAQTAEAEAEAEAEYEQELADEPQPMGPEAARQAVTDESNAYIKKYGMDAAQEDILKALVMRFTDGSVTQLKKIPEGMHATVAQDIKDLTRTNFFKRKPLP